LGIGFNKVEEGFIDCKCHGKTISSIVCCHLIKNFGQSAGFIENSNIPEDLQAWCNECESLFNIELELTDKFKAFNDFSVVCCKCYQDIKVKHSTAI
jgi:hypothetical protein